MTVLQKMIRYGLVAASLLLGLEVLAVERLPAGVLRLDTHFSMTGTYDHAFASGRSGTSLKNHLIGNRDLYGLIDGDVEREESRVTVDAIYGITTSWALQLEIPWVFRRQTSSLSLVDLNDLGVLDEQGIELVTAALKSIANLSSETVEGLGDVVLRSRHEFYESDRLLLMGGPGVRLPTGKAGTPRGVDALALGDRQTDLLAFFSVTVLPPTTGLQYDLQLEVGNEMSGTRETLQGVKGDYFGGNWLHASADVSYQHSNWFYGGGVHYQLRTDSVIAKEEQDNGGASYRSRWQIGYGNLHLLEKDATQWPFQVRVIWDTPLTVDLAEDFYIIGENTPQINTWSVMARFYF